MCEPLAAGTVMNSLFLSKRPAQSLQEHLLGIFISLIANGSRFATYSSKMNLSSISAF